MNYLAQEVDCELCSVTLTHDSEGNLQTVCKHLWGKLRELAVRCLSLAQLWLYMPGSRNSASFWQQFARAYFLQIVIGSEIHLSIWFFVVYCSSGAKPGANHNAHRESSPTCFGNTTACLAKRYWLNLKPEISYSKPVDFVDWKAGCTLTRSFHYPSSHNKHTFPYFPAKPTNAVLNKSPLSHQK